MKLFKKLSALMKPRKKSADCYSVRDFPKSQDLKTVLDDKKQKRPSTSLSSSSSAEMSDVSSKSFDPIEWKLSNYDKKETEPQTMEQEMKRLQNLQDYFVLDSAAEVEFDSITNLASMTFDAPMALVSLVDLGRQWFLSKVGIDAEETPRKFAFCAHVVVNKYNLLVVPDATQDVRFKDNPLVTGAPHIRFYAGAALVSPEGYKLGTLCIVSPKVRPGGLTVTEQNMLHSMARLVVNAMVARRDRLVKQEYETKMKDLGESVVQTAISLRKTQRKLSQTVDEEALGGILDGLQVHTQTCEAVARSLLEDVRHSKRQNESNGTDSNKFDFECALEDICEPKTKLPTLIDNLGSVLKSFPRKGLVTLELDAACPEIVVGEDLLLFRSALNLVANSMQRCNTAQDVDPTIVFRIRCDEDVLVFETEDSGPAVSKRSLKNAFRDKDSLLGPVATMVRTMRGTCGMRTLHQGASDKTQDKCIFWFRIPLELPASEAFGYSDSHNEPCGGMTLTLESNANSVVPAPSTSQKAPTVVEDPFQIAIMASGCRSY